MFEYQQDHTASFGSNHLQQTIKKGQWPLNISVDEAEESKSGLEDSKVFESFLMQSDPTKLTLGASPPRRLTFAPM